METKSNPSLRDDFLMVLLTQDQKNKIRELSKKENRSLSSFVLNATIEYIQDNYTSEVSSD